MDIEPIQVGATYILAQLCPKPLAELGEILADRARLWRYNNQLKLLQEAKEHAEKEGREINPVHLKTLLPLLDGASLEEEPEIQKLWAKLLIHAGSMTHDQHVANTAVEFLKSISPTDAVLVSTMFTGVKDINVALVDAQRKKPAPGLFEPTFNPHIKISYRRLRDLSRLSGEAFEFSYDNISRFNIIESPAPSREDKINGRPSDGEREYRFTRFGWKVVSLINGFEPGPPKPF